MTTSRIVVPALLVAGFLAPGTQAAAQTFMFERSFPATASTRLDVTTNRGKITVHAGATADVVVVGRVSVRVAWNSPGNAVALARSTANQPPVEQTGDTIRLQIPRDGRTRRAVTIAYEVLVPAGIRVVTHSESGETRVDGVRGTVSVRTQSGAITLADLGATRVDTGSGAVSIDGAGPLSVTTSSSGIEMTRISGNLDVQTQSGRVTASLVNEGDVDVETGSSAITIDGVGGRRTRRLDPERPRAGLGQPETGVAGHHRLQRHRCRVQCERGVHPRRHLGLGIGEDGEPHRARRNRHAPRGGIDRRGRSHRTADEPQRVDHVEVRRFALARPYFQTVSFEIVCPAADLNPLMSS